MREQWKVEDMAVGDFISVKISDPHGDVDGAILSGTIKDLEPAYKMVRLESGWCCHTKDKLVKHEKGARDE